MGRITVNGKPGKSWTWPMVANKRESNVSCRGCDRNSLVFWRDNTRYVSFVKREKERKRREECQLAA